MGEFRHFDDKGTLSFFIRDDGAFAIVCDHEDQHAWVGTWEGALVYHSKDSAELVVGNADGLTASPSPKTGDIPDWVRTMMKNQ